MSQCLLALKCNDFGIIRHCIIPELADLLLNSCGVIDKNVDFSQLFL